MQNKIQFINSYGKLHEYNFIRVALPDSSIVVYSDTGYAKPETAEIEDYYKEHSITVVKAKSFSNIRLGIIRRALNLFSAIRIIVKSRKEKYDYCFVHYLSTRRAILSLFVPKTTKLMLITYGSDILRRKNFNNYFFRKMIERANLIVFNSGNLRLKFEAAFGKKFDNKCVDIAFPCASFERLGKNLVMHTRDYSLGQLGLPNDKTIVVCGHTSTRDERHEQLIESLNNVSQTVLSKCFFVFPMTYGSGDYLTYRTTIKKKLSESRLDGVVLEEYMPFDQMCMLHSVSDIHITSITTDALSLFLLEELYSGSHVIYGQWLNYTEFKDNCFGADYYEDFSDLPEVFERVMNGKGTPTPINQKETIIALQSNETIAEKWASIIK